MKALRKYSLLVALAFGCFGGYGQNLVPNPGFESNTGIPNSLGQWPLCQSWFNSGSLTADPDYYHVLGSASGDLPVTPAAIVYPRSGNAVMGLLVFNKFQANHREYLSIQLSQPMVPGQKYLVSFFITNGVVTDASNAGIGVSKLGALLSVNYPVQSGNDVLLESPQFMVNSVLYDRNWRKLQFTLIADAPHEYLTIGLFQNDADIQFAELEGTHPTIAYYFVDDFQVKVVTDNMSLPDSGQTTDNGNSTRSPAVPVSGRPEGEMPFFIPNSFTPNGDGINDTFGPKITNLENYEFSIFDRWGNLIFTTTNCAVGWNGKYHGEDAEAGIYVWQITYSVRGLHDLPESGSCRGSVNLLR